MGSDLVSTYLDQNYILLLQISSLSVGLFYLGLEPKRERQRKGMLEIFWYVKRKKKSTCNLISPVEHQSTLTRNQLCLALNTCSLKVTT